jgi:hypothetical protein
VSFHEDLLLQLRADLAQALSVPAAAVYVGREPQKITRQGLEVWIHALQTEQRGRGGGDQVKLHPYELHVRLKTRREGDKTGVSQLDTVRRALESLRERYDGTRPFVAALPALIAVQVEEASLDDDAGDDDLLDGALLLRVLER